jgi:deoxycytidylate deaminase
LLFNDTHIQLAREIALQSPCTRRKYGVVITNGIDTVVTNNQRVSRCCNGVCVRDALGIYHGERTDVGAEVHAEQAALIRWNKPVDKHTAVLIQAFYRDQTIPGEGIFLYPCHACAMMLKFAGFKNIWLTENNQLVAVPIANILDYWEEALFHEDDR